MADAKRLCRAQTWFEISGNNNESSVEKEQARVVSCLYHFIYSQDQDTTPEYKVYITVKGLVLLFLLGI